VDRKDKLPAEIIAKREPETTITSFQGFNIVIQKLIYELPIQRV